MAITFDGSGNDHYSFSGSGHPQGASFSVCARFRLNTYTVGTDSICFVLKNSDSSDFLDFICVYYDASGNLYVAQYINGSLIGSTACGTIPLNTNFHLGLTWTSGSTAKVYKDGALVGTSGTYSAYLKDDFTLGGGGGEGCIDGSFEAFKYWDNTVLTLGEMAAEAASVAAVKTSGLFDAWRFTAYSGSSYTGTNNAHGLTNSAGGDVYLASDLDPPGGGGGPSIGPPLVLPQRNRRSSGRYM